MHMLAMPNSQTRRLMLETAPSDGSGDTPVTRGLDDELNAVMRPPELTTAYRQIYEEHKRVAQHYRETVEFDCQSAPSGVAGDVALCSSRWKAPQGADVFEALSVQKANRALEDGPRTYEFVCQVADRLAAAIVVREHGVETVSRALWAGRVADGLPVRNQPEPPQTLREKPRVPTALKSRDHAGASRAM